MAGDTSCVEATTVKSARGQPVFSPKSEILASKIHSCIQPKDDDDDHASIVSMGSDSTSGPFFWYRVVSKFVPKARNCHSATMIGDTMLVFGGFGGSKWYDELWSFNTVDIEWQKPELEYGISPPPRYAHSAVSFRGLLYIFGGYGGDDNWLGDLWALDTQRIRVRDRGRACVSWFKPATTGTPPCPRAAHTASIVGNKLFVFGGNNGTSRMNDLVSLDTQTLVWKKEHCTGALPRPRAGHSMNLIPAESSSEDSNPKLLLFAGGDITHVYNDLHTLDTETLVWSHCKTTGPAPSPRAGHCTTILPDGILLVWGGGSVDRVMNDLHLLDPRSMTWSGSVDLGKMVPEPRVGHTITCKGSEVFVFGGGDSVTVFGDLIILDTDALSSHWAGRRNSEYTSHIGRDGVLARAFIPPIFNHKDVPKPPLLKRDTGRNIQIKQPVPVDEDEIHDAGTTWGEMNVEGEQSTLARPSIVIPKDIFPPKASIMQDKYRQLAHKLTNRPSKEDLVHLNILKGSNSIQPNILAAQQRLQMRKTGSTLEMKLHRRPDMHQLVMHNIIPEEDEYVEHEIRLWGHIPGVVHGQPGDAVPDLHQEDPNSAVGDVHAPVGNPNNAMGRVNAAVACMENTNPAGNVVSKPKNLERGAMDLGLSQLEYSISNRMNAVRKCVDSFQQQQHDAGCSSSVDCAEDVARLADAVRAELLKAQNTLLLQVSLLKALAQSVPPVPPSPPKACNKRDVQASSRSEQRGSKRGEPVSPPPMPPAAGSQKKKEKAGRKVAGEDAATLEGGQSPDSGIGVAKCEGGGADVNVKGDSSGEHSGDSAKSAKGVDRKQGSEGAGKSDVVEEGGDNNQVQVKVGRRSGRGGQAVGRERSRDSMSSASLESGSKDGGKVRRNTRGSKKKKRTKSGVGEGENAQGERKDGQGMADLCVDEVNEAEGEEEAVRILMVDKRRCAGDRGGRKGGRGGRDIGQGNQEDDAHVGLDNLSMSRSVDESSMCSDMELEQCATGCAYFLHL